MIYTTLPGTLIVSVTRADITKAVRGDTDYGRTNPIAMALKRLFPSFDLPDACPDVLHTEGGLRRGLGVMSLYRDLTDVEVCSGRVPNTEGYYTLPKAARAFLKRFERGDRVDPITFRSRFFLEDHL